jgi:O-antigen/teichoic acid export membrane protein
VAIAVSSVANYLYSLALTHSLEPRSYSEFAAGQALLLLVATLGGVAVPWVLAREVARNGDDEVQLGRALTFAFWVNVAFGAILGALVAVISSWIGPPPIPEIMAASIFLLSIGSTGSGYLQGRQRYGLLAAVLFGEIAVKVSLGFFLVGILGFSAWAALFAATVGALVPLSVCIPLRHRIGRPIWSIGVGVKELW